MNLDLFNRVNLKTNICVRDMYLEWASLSPTVQTVGCNDTQSVLDKFGLPLGKDIAVIVVKQLAGNLGLTQAPAPSILTTDKEVQWCMEVLCFGLSLPLTEHDAVKDCVNVYCEWLSALLPNPKICVPKPVCEDANLYSRKIISHFHNLFVPRKGEGLDIINRQAVLCHRVLRTLQNVVNESRSLERETWEAVLLFLIAINDTLLAPPTVRDDVADQLCERVVSVLFEVWLIACSRCFPSPPLWKTLRESCMNWRHRIALVEQWNRVNLALTAKVLAFLYGPSFPELKIGEDDLIPPMTNDFIAQSWFRFLHCLDSPVSFTKPNVISQTQKFLQFAMSNDKSANPCQHPCLQTLPTIFLKAIKGVAGQVDAFLGIAQPYSWGDVVASSDKNKEVGTNVPTTGHSSTPPTHRRLAKSFSGAPSSGSKGLPKVSVMGLTSSRPSTIQPSPAPSSGPSSSSSLSSLPSLGPEGRPPLAPDRPKCNSILHLFGEWLFECAYIGSDNLTSPKSSSNSSVKRPSSVVMDNHQKGSLNLSQPGSFNETPEIPPYLSLDKYEAGRAEAIGALCRIMCAKKTGEEILTVYLARFYLAMQQGLKITGTKECGETLVSILLNSSDIFRLDLDGVRVLLPSIISALEIVLADKDLNLKTNVSSVELRRASISILLSILALPLHFQNLMIRPLINSNMDRPMTFAQLKPRLMNLVMNALQGENDPQNTHMLLGGLMFCVLDASTLEAMEQVQQPSLDGTSSNLLSSVSDTGSMASGSFQSFHEDSDDSQTTLDTANALFVRATFLVCYRLISSWKTDLNVSLAALELLSGLARIHIKEAGNALECKRAVKWLCDYIVHQCSRPPPAHSKDLHSTIVAAFQCCSVWLLEHPYLLRDKDSLTTVLEVAELGVSGAKSIGKPGEEIRLKETKELKPASMRVRDAAESLLTTILEQVGYFPNECGPESISSLLNELSLLQHCNSWPSTCTDRKMAVERFRYFVSEGSVMLALLEEPLGGNDQDPQPTVTMLIRGPFGRHAWTMQLRHLPRHKSGTKYHAPNPGRPVAMHDTPIRPEVKHKYFPDSVERISHCNVDQSIPALESIFSNDAVAAEESFQLSQLIEKQSNVESALTHGEAKTVECAPPTVVHEFQTARLFLSHFGFLSLDNVENGETPLLSALDSSAADFCKDLDVLDALSSRTCDTVHLFYVKAGQNNASQILHNVDGESIPTEFYDFLLTLGWPIDVDNHPGWTGHTSTSWKLLTNVSKSDPKQTVTNKPKILYWADAGSEIAFVVPTKMNENKQSRGNSPHLSSWYEKVSSSENAPREQRTMSLDLEKQAPPLRRTHQTVHTNTKIMVVWLENFEDHLQLPIDDLLHSMDTGLEQGPIKSSDVLVICLHWLETGLLRVHLQGPGGRVGLATPLVSGMVVSRRAVGTLVRHTALNMARRRRLDSDNYQPPHVRRRLKIQDMVQKYKKEMTMPELLTYLFSNP